MQAHTQVEKDDRKDMEEEPATGSLRPVPLHAAMPAYAYGHDAQNKQEITSRQGFDWACVNMCMHAMEEHVHTGTAAALRCTTGGRLRALQRSRFYLRRFLRTLRHPTICGTLCPLNIIPPSLQLSRLLLQGRRPFDLAVIFAPSVPFFPAVLVREDGSLLGRDAIA